MTVMNFDFLATELAEKAKNLGNLGASLKFVFEGEGSVHIDAHTDAPSVSRDDSKPADITVTAPLNVWLDLRAKKLAPHVAAMTRKLRIQGDVAKGMRLAPRIMAVL